MQQVIRDTAVFQLPSHHLFLLYKGRWQKDTLAHLDAHDPPFLQLGFFFLFKGITHHFDPYWLLPTNLRVPHSLWKEVKYFTFIIQKSIGFQIPT